MELNLVKTDHFNGNLIEVYADDKNEFFMTREQIGKALGYAEPRIAITKIHQRHEGRLDNLSGDANLVSPRGGGTQKTTVYTMRGCMEICRWSQQPKADAFMDKVWDLMEWLNGKRSTVQSVTPAQGKAYQALSDLFHEEGEIRLNMGILCEFAGIDHIDGGILNDGVMEVGAKRYQPQGERMPAPVSTVAARSDAMVTSSPPVVGQGYPRAFYTIEELRQYIPMSAGGIYKACKENTIPSVKIGRRVFIPAWFIKTLYNAMERR